MRLGLSPHGHFARALAAISILAISVVAASADDTGAAPPLKKPDPTHFPVPKVLEPNVEFWLRVYTEHDSHFMLLHDDSYLRVVYETIDLTDIDKGEASFSRRWELRRDRVRAVRDKYKAILHDLAADRVSAQYPDDQERVRQLFGHVPGSDRARYGAAVNRLRTQTCLRDHFAEAIARSGLYLPAIERIFRQRGLPIELTRLPFVESMFQIRAHSSAAAAGIWQFMPGTARLFLKMELEYDERYDPLRATEAAATLLAKNYEKLQSWPLAVTAYNHGTNGMQRAAASHGSDLGKIVEQYRSRTFGFASRNFYAELIAATLIYENRERFFSGVRPLPELQFDEIVPDQFVSATELAEKASSSVVALQELNPGLNGEIWTSDLYFPKGYPLRVPKGQGETFKTAYRDLPDSLKSASQVGLMYKVRSGDTLGKIAARFGTTVGAMQRANKLADPHRIRVGQTLLIPPGRRIAAATVSSVARPTSSATSNTPTTHVVRRGETLASIARRYGTSVSAIQGLNRIAGSLIHPAQVLIIP